LRLTLSVAGVLKSYLRVIEDLLVSIVFGTKSKSEEPLALSGSLNLKEDNHDFSFVKVFVTKYIKNVYN
jgi:hypothetical protein